MRVYFVVVLHVICVLFSFVDVNSIVCPLCRTTTVRAMDHPLFHKTHHSIQEIQQLFQQLSSAAETNLVECEIQTKIAAVNA